MKYTYERNEYGIDEHRITCADGSLFIIEFINLRTALRFNGPFAVTHFDIFQNIIWSIEL
ncbi:hypothetical protein AHIS1_p025 [Acaryochloris phage A-HIS1]|nr:hypothetical protein AHIS1_p025 [Acaryochloris phage A-HIS1]